MNRTAVLIGALFAMTSLVQQDARACSQPECGWPRFSPSTGVTVPANLPAIHWRPGYSYLSPTPDPTKLTLTKTNDTSVPLPFTATALTDGSYAIVPGQPWLPSTSYTLTDNSACGERWSTFKVVAAAPLPTRLGEALVEPIGGTRLTAPSSSGSCLATVWADEAIINVTPAAETMPWLHALVFETVVDGAVWNAEPVTSFDSFTGVDYDRVYHLCRTNDQGAAPGIAAGPHDIVVRASLPGTATVLMSSAVTVMFDCDEDPDVVTCNIDPDLCEEEAVVDPSFDDSAGCCSTSNRTPGVSSVLLALLVLVRLRRQRTLDRARNRSR